MLVICNEMPRSGSTLQYNICRGIVEKLDMGKGEGFFYENQLLPLLDKFLEWGQDDRFHIIKIHAFHPKTVEMTLTGWVKICYIYRDIRDVAVSIKNKDKVDRKVLIDNLDAAIETDYKLKQVPNILIQKYEDVVIDVYKAIAEVDLFLGLKANEDVIKWVVQECSVENTKKVMLDLAVSSQNSQLNPSLQAGYDPKTLLHHKHISRNSGTIGVWRVELEQEEINLITERYKSWLIEAQYLLR